MKQHFKVNIHHDLETGWYCADCFELGIFTEAQTLEGVQNRVAEIAPEMIEIYMKRQSETAISRMPKLRFVNDVQLVAV